MDLQLRMGALDAAWSERLHSGAVRDIASPFGDFGINPSPGYASYSYPVFPAIKAEYLAGRGRATSGKCPDQEPMITLPSPFSPAWQDDIKKPVAYKSMSFTFLVGIVIL